jgi:Mn2+/Fe2+ NRAMP family transporter
MWFSYWVAARGYGGEVPGETESEALQKSRIERSQTEEDTRRGHLRSWLITMGITAGIGIVGGTIINISFLTLGAQLLKPQGIMPEGVNVAADLAMLLSEVWGRLGFWLLIVGIVIALWGSVLANQDGWGRMFTDATYMLLGQRRGGGRLRSLLSNRQHLRNAYIAVVLTAFPAILFLIIRDPVRILAAGGIISATHMPFVVFLTLFLNRRRLPKAYRPGLFWFVIMVIVGLYYSYFAGYFFYDLLGLSKS